jgi:hypothetical protein
VVTALKSTATPVEIAEESQFFAGFSRSRRAGILISDKV